jgi:VIT1/CCC1 family predicted Fe2+/Mn2+ transporter
MEPIAVGPGHLEKAEEVLAGVADDDCRAIADREREVAKFERARAKEAFRRNDIAASKIEHSKERDHSENHQDGASEFVKSVVFGGLDGIMTTFAIVNAAASGGGDWKTVLLLGLSNVVADGFSMGFGEFVGGDAERDHALMERARETWEVENCKEMEIDEMVRIYEARGISEEDSRTIVNIIAKDPKLFVDFMMVDELGILIDEDDKWGPLKQGIVMFVSFIVFGSVPVLPYLSQSGKGVDGTFFAALVITAIALVILGGIKGHLTGLDKTKSAITMVFNGSVSGLVSFTTGLLVQKVVGSAPPM